MWRPRPRRRRWPSRRHRELFNARTTTLTILETSTTSTTFATESTTESTTTSTSTVTAAAAQINPIYTAEVAETTSVPLPLINDDEVRSVLLAI